MACDNNRYTVSAVNSALDIMDILAVSGKEETITSLMNKLGLSSNKTFRLLTTLESRGIVEREKNRGVYRLALPAVELAQRVLNSASLIKNSRPVMEELARKHGEAIYMTVLREESVLFLDMVESAQQVRTVPFIGKRVPALSNAAGKAIKQLYTTHLADRESKSKQMVRGVNLIRQRGVVIDQGGLGDGVVSVAACVLDYAGRVVGALTMLAPAFRMMTSRLEEEVVPSLLEGAEAISLKFGYSPI